VIKAEVHQKAEGLEEVTVETIASLIIPPALLIPLI